MASLSKTHLIIGKGTRVKQDGQYLKEGKGGEPVPVSKIEQEARERGDYVSPDSKEAEDQKRQEEISRAKEQARDYKEEWDKRPKREKAQILIEQEARKQATEARRKYVEAMRRPDRENPTEYALEKYEKYKQEVEDINKEYGSKLGILDTIRLKSRGQEAVDEGREAYKEPVSVLPSEEEYERQRQEELRTGQSVSPYRKPVKTGEYLPPEKWNPVRTAKRVYKTYVEPAKEKVKETYSPSRMAEWSKEFFAGVRKTSGYKAFNITPAGKTLRDIRSGIVFTGGKIEEAGKRITDVPDYRPVNFAGYKGSVKISEDTKSFYKGIGGFVEGAGRGLKEKPYQTAITYGISYGIGRAVGGGLGILKNYKKAQLGLNIGLMGVEALYYRDVGIRIYNTPAGFRTRKAGEIFSTELAPIHYGATAGYKSSYYGSTSQKIQNINTKGFPDIKGYAQYKYEQIPTFKEYDKLIIKGENNIITKPIVRGEYIIKKPKLEYLKLYGKNKGQTYQSIIKPSGEQKSYIKADDISIITNVKPSGKARTRIYRDGKLFTKTKYKSITTGKVTEPRLTADIKGIDINAPELRTLQNTKIYTQKILGIGKPQVQELGVIKTKVTEVLRTQTIRKGYEAIKYEPFSYTNKGLKPQKMSLKIVDTRYKYSDYPIPKDKSYYIRDKYEGAIIERFQTKSTTSQNVYASSRLRIRSDAKMDFEYKSLYETVPTKNVVKKPKSDKLVPVMRPIKKDYIGIISISEPNIKLEQTISKTKLVQRPKVLEYKKLMPKLDIKQSLPTQKTGYLETKRKILYIKTEKKAGQKPKVMQKSSKKNILKIDTKIKQKSEIKLATKTKVKQKQKSEIKLATKTKVKQKLKLKTKINVRIRPRYNIPIIPINRIKIPYITPIMEFGKRKSVKKKKKKGLRITKQTSKYTPQVFAQVFDISGKKPKGYESGLVFRPKLKV